MVNLVVGFERSGKTRKFQEMIKNDLKEKKKVRVVCLHGDVEEYKKVYRRAKVMKLVEDTGSFKNILQHYKNKPYVIVSTPSNISELSFNSEENLNFTFGQSEILSLLSQRIDSLYIDDAHIVLRKIVESTNGIQGISNLLNHIQVANLHESDVYLACRTLSSLSTG